jgi:hypothetical protein
MLPLGSREGVVQSWNIQVGPVKRKLQFGVMKVPQEVIALGRKRRSSSVGVHALMLCMFRMYIRII